MRKNILFISIFFVAVLLIGCASTGQIVRSYDSPYAEKDSKNEINLLLEQVDTTGVLETPALREGKVSFYEVVFPEMLYFGEMYPARLKWYGWVVNKDKEFLAQIVYIHKISLTGKIIGGVMIDGTLEELSGGKIIGFSTRMNFVYGLDIAETETSIVGVRNDILASKDKRRELVEKYGIEISRLPKADYLLRIIDAWNRFETERGVILSPLSEGQFKEVARKNPGYSYSQKYVKNMKGSISPDPIAIGMNVFMDFATAAGADSEGWDFGSRESKRLSAIRGKHLSNLKQQVIDILNERLDERGKGEVK